MASGILHKSIGASQLKGGCDSNSRDLRNKSSRFLPNGYAFDIELLGKGVCRNGHKKMHSIQTLSSSSQASVVEPISSTSNSSSNYSQNPLSE